MKKFIISPEEKSECKRLFGENLRRIRIERGYSQLELSALLDKGGNTLLSRIENGKANITLMTAFMLSKALNVEIKELFNFCVR